jgi:hypothetical protein
MNNTKWSLLMVGIGISMLVYNKFRKTDTGNKWQFIVGGIGAIISGILSLFVIGKVIDAFESSYLSSDDMRTV